MGKINFKLNGRIFASSFTLALSFPIIAIFSSPYYYEKY
jgi:hypothetical protein